MTDVINFTKQAFTWSVVAMTIVWSLGLATLAPVAASAATCATIDAGELVKFGTAPAVYVVDEDMALHTFTTPEQVGSWGLGNTDVTVVDATCINNYNNPSTMAGRGFSYGLMKPEIGASVYLLALDGKMYSIQSAADATTLWGPSWGSLMKGIAPFLASNYAINSATPLNTASLPNEVLISYGGKMWVHRNGSVFEIVGGVNSFLAARAIIGTDAMIASLSGGVSSTTVSASSLLNVVRGFDMGTTPGTPGTPTTPVSQGELMVSLAASTADAAVVPQSASQVPYLTFNLRANGGDVMVETVSFKRVGLGSDDNFDKVWLTSNGVPVSNDQSVNSDDMVTLSPNMMVKSGTTVTLTLVANLVTADTSQQDAFQITSAGSVEISGTGDVEGSFPVRGNLMSYSTYDVGTVILDEEGSDEDVEVGDEQVIVGEFSLDYNSDNESDAMVNFVRFKQDGEADMEDLDNLTLYEDGTMLDGVTAQVFGDYVTFMFSGDEAMLEDGDKRRFEIRADILDGTNDETYQFRLDDIRDLSVTETGTGFGATITDSLSQGTGTDGMYDYTVDAGQFSVSLDTTNPNNETYSKGSQDVMALVAKVDAGQKINVDGLRVYLSSATNVTAASGAALKTEIDADIERAELYVNNTRIASLTSVAGASADGIVDTNEFYYDFDSNFSVVDNDIIKLVLDIDENASSTNKYRFTFSNSGAGTNFDSPEYQSNGDTVPVANRTGSATGRDVEITDATVTITRNDGLRTDEPFIIGSGNNMVFGFLIDNGDDSEATIRTLNFDFANFSASATSSRVQNLYLTFNGVVVGDTEDLSSGSVTFNSLNYKVAQNKQVQVALYADFETGLATNATTTITLDQSESLIEDTNGDDITNWSDEDSAQLELVADPTLTVSVDGNTAKSTVLVANSAAPSVTLGTYRFEAKNGAVTLTDLYIANNYTTGGNDAESDADFLVSQYELVNAAGTILDTAAPSNGRARFELGSNEVTIAKDGIVRLSVRAKLNSISNVSQTGKQLGVALYAIEADGPNDQLSSIAGVAVIDNIAALDAAPKLNTHQVSRTVPTITAGGDDFLAPSYQKVLVNGDIEIFEFNLTADAGGDLSWKKIVLDTTGNCTAGAIANCLGATSSMRIEDKDGNVVDAIFSTSTGKLTIVLDGVDTVSAGQTETYSVYASITGFTGDNDSLTVRVRDNQSAFAVAANYAGVTSGTFVWSDNSGTFESAASVSWFNGYKTRSLDTRTLTLKQ